MSEYLKGNYKAPAVSQPVKSEDTAKNIQDDFEKCSLEKLGGSIAFVMKSKSFLWNGDSGKDASKGK